jgi:hypothetical protein
MSEKTTPEKKMSKKDKKAKNLEKQQEKERAHAIKMQNAPLSLSKILKAQRNAAAAAKPKQFQEEEEEEEKEPPQMFSREWVTIQRLKPPPPIDESSPYEIDNQYVEEQRINEANRLENNRVKQFVLDSVNDANRAANQYDESSSEEEEDEEFSILPPGISHGVVYNIEPPKPQRYKKGRGKKSKKNTKKRVTKKRSRKYKNKTSKRI